KDYEQAVKFYSAAIELNPGNAIYFGNRSLAHLRTEAYGYVVKVRPNDKDAKLKYQECHKIVKQKAFERAIASDPHRRSVVDTLDIESMTIEDEYSGPKLEDGKVTLTFMTELMQ
ncbi:serine/threonine-protein phosphatase 5-like, partial [Columba livia]